ncbi:MAG: transcriptional regulator [Bacteroidetes bacterium]|nr:MAG: transcriptional regulator [Bacteroidota bacterium]
MKTLKYIIIKSKKHYNEYCKALEDLLGRNENSKDAKDEIDLLTLLIDKWDAEHSTFKEVDPIELLHSLMRDHQLKAKDMVKILGVSKGLVSDILNYKKGLSKDIIRILAGHFKVSQEAFNRPYKLKNPVNSHLRDASVMNTHKEIELAY